MGLQFKWFTRLEPLHDPSRQLKKHVRCPLGVLHGRGLFVWRNLCSTMLNVRICADLYSCIGYLWTLPRCIMDEHKLSNCVAPESAWNPPHTTCQHFFDANDAASNWQLLRMHQFFSKPQPWNLDQVEVDKKAVDPAKTDMFSLEMVLEQNKIS